MGLVGIGAGFSGAVLAGGVDLFVLVLAALVVPVLLFLSSIGMILDAGLPTGLDCSVLFSIEAAGGVVAVVGVLLELDNFVFSVVWPSIMGASL